jgi:hypothetical protein
MTTFFQWLAWGRFLQRKIAATSARAKLDSFRQILPVQWPNWYCLVCSPSSNFLHLINHPLFTKHLPRVTETVLLLLDAKLLQEKFLREFHAYSFPAMLLIRRGGNCGRQRCIWDGYAEGQIGSQGLGAFRG